MSQHVNAQTRALGPRPSRHSSHSTSAGASPGQFVKFFQPELSLRTSVGRRALIICKKQVALSSPLFSFLSLFTLCSPRPLATPGRIRGHACSYKIISFEINKLKPVGRTGNEGLCDSSYQLVEATSGSKEREGKGKREEEKRSSVGLAYSPSPDGSCLAAQRLGDMSFSCI